MKTFMPFLMFLLALFMFWVLSSSFGCAHKTPPTVSEQEDLCWDVNGSALPAKLSDYDTLDQPPSIECMKVAPGEPRPRPKEAELKIKKKRRVRK